MTNRLERRIEKLEQANPEEGWILPIDGEAKGIYFRPGEIERIMRNIEGRSRFIPGG